MKFILGKKLGMTRIFDKDGLAVSVTLVEAGPCVITHIKKEEKDDYNAVQIGFGTNKKINKSEAGHLKKANTNSKYLKELKLAISDQPTADSEYKVGDKITVEAFKPGDIVAVSGISKGKGFAGVVKRHHFAGGPKSHGSDQHRAPGSIGAQQPQRVIKGTRMAGHMGREKITTKHLEVVEIISEKNILLIKGPVPGSKNSLVEIRG